MSWFLSVSITNKPFAKKIPPVVRMVQNRHARKQEMQWGNTATEITILNHVSSVSLLFVLFQCVPCSSAKQILYYVNDQLQRAHPLLLNVCSNSYLKSCICRRFDKNTNSNNFLPKISTTVRSKRSYHGMFKRFRLSISSYNDYLLRDLEGACFQVEIQLTSSSISTRCRLSSGRKHC